MLPVYPLNNQLAVFRLARTDSSTGGARGAAVVDYLHRASNLLSCIPRLNLVRGYTGKRAAGEGGGANGYPIYCPGVAELARAVKPVAGITG